MSQSHPSRPSPHGINPHVKELWELSIQWFSVLSTLSLQLPLHHSQPPRGLFSFTRPGRRLSHQHNAVILTDPLLGPDLPRIFNEFTDRVRLEDWPQTSHCRPSVAPVPASLYSSGFFQCMLLYPDPSFRWPLSNSLLSPFSSTPQLSLIPLVHTFPSEYIHYFHFFLFW